MTTERKIGDEVREARAHSEGSITMALHRTLSNKGVIFLPQVRNATGFSRRARTADGIAMSTWPSRGYAVEGFEIKISKSDWNSELKKPEKAEEIYQYCNLWWVVAPVGIVDPRTLPPTWGLQEIDDEERLRVKVRATPLQPKALDLGFIASIVRSCSEWVLPQKLKDEKHEEELSKRYQKGFEDGKDSVERSSKYLMGKVEEFTKKTGIDISATWRFGDVSKLHDLLSYGPAELDSEITSARQTTKQHLRHVKALKMIRNKLNTCGPKEDEHGEKK